MDYMQRYQSWLNDVSIDEATKAELSALSGNEKEIEDRFFKDLEFGTAGLRGVIGAGTNRMNKYTVGRATQGLANFILSQGEDRKKMGVVIAYDSRRKSPEFAEISALCLNANGIKAYVFDELKPTPELSFAVRHLGCSAGINITASHNPPEYNGYKVYWEDGAQISAPIDKQIMAEVSAINDLSTIKFADKEEAVKQGLFNIVGSEIDDVYIENVKAQVQDKQALSENAKNLKVVYTPLHGTGTKLVKRVLKDVGFDNVFVVKEQELPDPNFTTVDYPNPEDPKVFTLGIELAEKENADIVVATDPDADRVGAVVKNENGEYIIITGNMSGTLICHYILDSRKKAGTLPADGVVIKTIVTTNMVDIICREYGVEIMEVLTGFKFIGEKIKEFEEKGNHQYVFGFEESFGCLCGTYARDKDAVVATMLLCELAAKLKAEGKTVYQGLMDLYKQYGYFKEEAISITLAGAEGLQKMSAMMENIRVNAPDSFGGHKVTVMSDYQSSVTKNVITGETSQIDLPKSNVVKFLLADGSWVCVRPSGTEPKIKFYMGVKSDSMDNANAKFAEISKDVTKIANK